MKELYVRRRSSTRNAIIIIDIRMKYEIESSGEYTVGNYGKWSLDWHGMAIIFLS